MNKNILTILVFLTILSHFCSGVLAQVNSSGIAISTPIEDPDAKNQEIICAYTEGNMRCKDEYDSAIYGVISDDPAVAIKDFDLDRSRLVISSGIATVRVTSINGNISKGDLVTTSMIPGLGQRATRNGYVLGAAIENYESDDSNAIGYIQVALNIHSASGLSSTSGNLFQFIKRGVTVPLFEPVDALRYILAALMVIISFTLGMIYFGRSSRTGIEAVGRNPLAKRVIQLTIFMNIVLTIVIVMVGLAIAYLILIL
jgi:F0F1-type ATP synthase membrane subunit c/vacuolar-type H+-ATPase subunit K